MIGPDVNKFILKSEGYSVYLKVGDDTPTYS